MIGDGIPVFIVLYLSENADAVEESPRNQAMCAKPADLLATRGLNPASID
jgi:hypothetical protein